MRWFGRRRQDDAPAIATITPAELKRRLDRGEQVVLLDVRQPSAVAEFPGSIPGSVRITPADLPSRYDEVPRGRLVVPYCT